MRICKLHRSGSRKRQTGLETTITNGYQVGVPAPASSALTYDANGNMTSDGTNTYSWDAENRLLRITYPGVNNFTDFSYDQFGRNVKIVETTSGSVTSTKQFVWSGKNRDEQRDSGGTISAKFLSLGEIATTTSYFYTLDHLGSVREMTDIAGSMQDQRAYDPFGVCTKLSGTLSSDVQYSGYYAHARSSANLTISRMYQPAQGRFISREPSTDEYTYVRNRPSILSDPSGLYGTFDFVDHYYRGGGKSVDLGDVGLGGAFESSPDVQSAASGFSEAADSSARELAEKICSNRKPGDCCIQRTNYPASFGIDVNNTASDQLFAVGHSWLKIQATCRLVVNCCQRTYKLKCKAHFYIRDMFADPLGIGLESPGGQPYQIRYDFNRNITGSGSF